MRLLIGYSGSSMSHGLDPRPKLVWLIGNLILILLWNEMWVLWLNLGLILAATVASGISLRVFLPLLRVFGVIAVQFVLLQGLLRQEGHVIWKIGFVEIYLGGLLVGLQGIMALLAICLLFLQFIVWTSPEELTLLLVKLRLPQKYAVLVGLALRFLPTLEKDLRAIYESQKARGLELTTAWQKAKGLFPVALPLILRTLKRAQEVALSMDMKGYGLYPTRTFLGTLQFSKADWIVCTGLCGYFGAATILWITRPF